MVPLGYHRNMIVLKSKGSLQARTSLCNFQFHFLAYKLLIFPSCIIFYMLPFLHIFTYKILNLFFCLTTPIVINNQFTATQFQPFCRYTTRYVTITCRGKVLHHSRAQLYVFHFLRVQKFYLC